LANNIWYIRDGGVGTLEAALNVVKAIVPAISTTFDNLGLAVNVAINSTLNAVNFDALYFLGVILNLNNLADGMDFIQGNVTILLGNGDSLKTSRTNLATAVNDLATIVGYIDGNVTSWSNAINPLPVSAADASLGFYFKTIPIGTNGIANLANNAQKDVQQSPDGATQLNPLRTLPNLGNFATEIRGIVRTLNVDTRQKVLAAGNCNFFITQLLEIVWVHLYNRQNQV
jgi:hypothetical protein